jgi:hypothetical protein
MTEVKVVQGTDEWKAERIGRITGSNFNNLMKSPKQRKLPFNDTQLDYLYSVIAEGLTENSEDDFESYDMRRGTELEPIARQAYSDKHMMNVRECGIFTDDGMIAVSPDGICADETILEIKCPKAKTHVKYMLNPESLFKQYKWQVIAEVWATGLLGGTIISYHPDFPDDKKIVEYEYEPTIEDFTELTDRLEECKQFVMDAVK